VIRTGGRVAWPPISMRLIALLTCLASPALATCPTAADLPAGVILVQNEPTFIRADFDLTARGLREVRLTRTPGAGNRVEARVADHVLTPALIDRVEGRSILTYDADVAALDELDRAGEARLSALITSETEGDRRRDLLFIYRGAGEAEILNCTYDTWTVRELRASDSEITTFEHSYAPALRLVLASREVLGDGAERVLFDYTWIGTAADVAR
jgi:hypothetical protein